MSLFQLELLVIMNTVALILSSGVSAFSSYVLTKVGNKDDRK